MQWTKLKSDEKSKVYEAKTSTLRAILVLGHIDHPDKWLLDVTPDIFNRTKQTFSAKTTPEDAMEMAEMRIQKQLIKLMEEVSA